MSFLHLTLPWLTAAGLILLVQTSHAELNSPAPINSPELINSPEPDSDILSLDIEQLMNMEVTSVSKKTQTLSDSAAAAFVITQEDIRQSGVTSIPEALRMAPGIEVARIDTNKWAITSRGFNSRFANKLLVMIDGRSVYTPAFSGVYWDVQDTLLEDIERIEVIRGPGAALWGANAVNGIINIITKNAIDTQGTLISTGGGTHERAFGSLRYGTQLSTDSYGKIYFKGNRRDDYDLKGGGSADDDWTSYQGGGRLDKQLNNQDHLTIQGDLYQNKNSEFSELAYLSPPSLGYSDQSTRSKGANILTRWEHTESLTSSYKLQVYYDYTNRDEAYADISHQTLDVEFQHRFNFLNDHDIIWGTGYRYIWADFDMLEGSYVEDNDNERLYNLFVQDEISLIENTLWLTLGSKFEHNEYTNWEIQPTARIFWNINPKHKLWSAISRANRIPTRFEYDSSVLFPSPDGNTVFNLQGNKNIKSEEVTSYEIGYRVIPSSSISIDTTVYYSEYKDLLDFKAVLTAPVLINLNNAQSGYTSGFELASHWQMNDWWNWDLAYNYYNQTLKSINNEQLSDSPHQNFSLRSNIQFRENLNLNLWLKYTDDFTDYLENRKTTIDSYTTLDARLAWQLNRTLELSVTGQNLLESDHIEYVRGSSMNDAVEVKRAVYFKLLWQY